ncbi:MAG: peroxiredoxin [Nitrospira sp.]|nr:peroxiredoxin [Nitrospira sp.]HBP90383.1 peroxiredoxin [Nitrospiraceae bacterium]HNP30337.1 peroxiredoxin [Nitrospirales bacterium]
MSEERGLPRIGDHAPDFSAVTTQQTDFNFSAWQEQHWVVLFSHPADFTPVCTTELMAFAQLNEQFRQRGVKLIGLSVDSIHSHLAWLRNMQEKMGATIPFPMIADVDMRVAKLYGMIHANASSTATVRAVFIIDPKRVIRALLYYPLNAGRNVDEVLRLVTALQTTDRFVCATPANWREGEKVVVPPPKTIQEIDQVLAKTEYEHRDFYLALKDASPAASSKPAEVTVPKPAEAAAPKPAEPEPSQPAESTPSAEEAVRD